MINHHIKKERRRLHLYTIGDSYEEVSETSYEELDTEEVKQELEKLKKKMEFNIPERFVQRFKNEYETVIVTNFDDDYHLSEEIKEKNNKFYKEFRELQKCNNSYRKINEYIEVLRKVINCLNIERFV